MREVVYARGALRVLRRIPANVAANLRAKIAQYAADPASLSANVIKLQGRGGWRLRVGDWRIVFDDDGVVLDVLEIGPRGGVYQR